ncbi:3-hydroxyisobutyrate dehydrogenase [Culex quinquefasciatus]|uniref:3-hydroxyisobutyrate dehydrogenase n=1 Tax=Culex quinquefasciatus TaxID=7176 RepID=B0WIH5_CULQU|nr:3-hydroxyisobutyrate dehydrogenase [Culex quinquefasciatus]|eukprot:XP_001848509.1 3-hydroxyisobutyrate dehydrogenase [Culex quinquefasciatus]
MGAAGNGRLPWCCQIFPPSAIKTKRTKSAGFKEAIQQIEDFIANPEYSAQLFTGEFDNRPETDVEFNKLRGTEQDKREDGQEG